MSGTVMEMIALFHIAARVVLKEAVRELKTDATMEGARAAESRWDQ